MKYIGKPLGIWLFFRKSFQQNLTAVFELTLNSSAHIFCIDHCREGRYVAD